MIVILFSSKKYNNPSNNYGDCIIVDTGFELFIYDCGHEEHAIRVERYMQNKGYTSVKVILSHNDSDHFNGVNYLINRGLVSKVYTLLLYKYKDEIKYLVNDGRLTRDSVAERIKEIYNNIDSLSGRVDLQDVFTNKHIADGITIVGPEKAYALAAVAKAIDNRESDIIDDETVTNAACVQLSISFLNGKKLLLTGDSSFESIQDTIKDHSAIQLPHHGKSLQAKKIFMEKENDTVYFVSDNTGDTNGGSDDLPTKGHVILNTLNGDQICEESTFTVVKTIGAYWRTVLP